MLAGASNAAVKRAAFARPPSLRCDGAVMVAAMVKADSADPAKYLPALKAIEYKGVTGNIAFDEKGDIKNGALTLMTYKGGKRTELAVIR